jgi:large subunit ribosomal protein L1
MAKEKDPAKTKPEKSDAAAKDAAPKEPKRGGKGAKAASPAEPQATVTAAPAADAAPAAVAPLEPTSKIKKRPGVPPRRGKKLREQLKGRKSKVAKEGALPLRRALQVLKQMKRSKFDETVEIHMKLGVDTTQADQMVRGSVSLPHGLGKTKRVLVFTQGDNVAKAKEAGADFVGGDDLIAKIQGESFLDFDVALATQDMMGKVSRLGKMLGPRGLMPTPKAGTVVTGNQDVGQAVREQKAGKVEYRTDKGGNVHAGVGKISFDDEKLAGNIQTFVDQIRAVKPSGVKGHYVQTVTVSATMSPGIPVAM